MRNSADRIVSAVLPGSRQHLLEVAGELNLVRRGLAARVPIVKRPSVTATCGLLAAVAMPGLAMPELELLTRWTLWLVAVDDLLDDLDLPDEPVADWVWRFLGDLPSNPDDADSAPGGGWARSSAEPIALPAVPGARSTLAGRHGRHGQWDAPGTGLEPRPADRTARL